MATETGLKRDGQVSLDFLDSPFWRAARAPAPARHAPAGLPFRINHVIAYGQSLACGFEGWPALSTVQPYDSLMLGSAVGAAQPHEPVWLPIGEGRFAPLVATVQDPANGQVVPAADVAALAPGSVVLGETILEAAVNTWRARLGTRPDFIPGARLLASTCGVGGRSIEALSRNAEIELFNRLRECAVAARSAATAEGLDYGIAAMLFLQGEQNNWGLDGSTTDRAEYKALLARLHDDFVADVARDIAGQSEAPPMFLYQTGGDYASDHMAIPQAQLELALERPGCYMAAPSYPVTSKVGHLDANGYRWLGAQFGKVMHRVLTLGERWRPLHPVRATLVNLLLFVDFHVPVPPLAWGRPYRGHIAIDVADHGFSVVDAQGPVPIDAVDLHGATAVRIRLARSPTGAARLRYADRAHHGRGSLHDSDATVADDCYVYDPATGHYPSANIPELVGRPYPLNNWCVAFDLPITTRES